MGRGEQEKSEGTRMGELADQNRPSEEGGVGKGAGRRTRGNESQYDRKKKGRRKACRSTPTGVKEV